MPLTRCDVVRASTPNPEVVPFAFSCLADSGSAAESDAHFDCRLRTATTPTPVTFNIQHISPWVTPQVFVPVLGLVLLNRCRLEKMLTSRPVCVLSRLQEEGNDCALHLP